MIAGTPSTPGLSPGTIESRIRTFESFGIHRTGWEGDDLTSRWLRDELTGMGVPAELERFDVPRVEVSHAAFTWGGGSIEGVPLYDAGFTGPGGVEADICEDDGADVLGCIVMATSALREGGWWRSPGAVDRIDELSARGAVGLVVPSGDADGAIVVRNAERIDRPHRLPVLQVTPGHLRAVLPDLALGGSGVLEIDASRLRSHATNVVAELPGTDADLPAVGLLTPKSGWFTCAAERGGGIAIWLALAEALASDPQRRRRVHMVATSGHELHHYGLRAHLRQRSVALAEMAGWLHLGASIGARHPVARIGCSDEELQEATTSALRAAGVTEYDALPAGDAGRGEARELLERGDRFVTFLGGHRYFHSPNDTTDRAVDAESIARWGAAALSVARALFEARS